MNTSLPAFRATFPARRFAALALPALLTLLAPDASAVPLVATNGTALFIFDSETPGMGSVEVIGGLRANETVVGIDYRPADGKLYAVTTAGRLGTLDIETGALTSVSPTGSINIAGNSFGHDFNPVVDRLRQVSDTEQNIRINPNDGTTANTDTPLSPAGTIVAAAYTNNFVGAQSTTLYGIDAAAGQLVRIGGPDGTPSPNGGQVTVIGSLGLGINLNQNIGFDIYSNAMAFACITFGGEQRLYSINLSTGAATSKGIIAPGTNLRGLTAVLPPPPPPVTAYGVTANGTLFRFLSTSASSVTTIGNVGFAPEGIDFRPGTTDLYALNVGPSTTQLYKINVENAAVTPVGQGFPSQVNNSYSLLNSTIGFDFNPTTLQADGSIRIRVVASNRSNLRVNSDTGAIAAIDVPLQFPGDPTPPTVDAAAYINTATPSSGGTTTLFDLDYTRNDLLTQNPANAGTLNTVGDSLINFDPGVSFDIFTEAASTDTTIVGDHGFAVLKLNGQSLYMFYEVNLATGYIVNGRIVGGGLDFGGGLAIRPPGGQFLLSAATYTVNEGAGSITVTVERVSGSVGAASVQIGTSLGSATAGADYVSTSTTLNFAAGETSKTFIVPVSDDASVEGDETFTIVLSSPSAGTTLGVPSSATVTIVDNDIPGVAISTTTNFSDNDAAPGATVRVGSTVTFEYVVTNPGNVPLSSVAVTDDNGTPGDTSDDFTPDFLNGDANGNNLLDPGETWTFTTTRVATAGQFSHIGTVSAAAASGGATIMASDPEYHFGIVPTVLANISTRLRVETGDRILIGGFIITGDGDKKVIIRALGPSVDAPGVLQNPTLEVYNSEGGLIAQNDNWQDAPNKQEIIDTTIPPSNDLEAAFVGTLAPGAYTALVFGVGDATGIGLVEVYDLDQTVDSDLGNIATRGFVQTGNDVLIGGLIVTGETQLKILLRGIGPSLNVGGKLADPTLELVNANGDTLLANDNWRETQESDIAATGIPPENDLESAILTTVQPANYTAIVRGRDETTGIGLVEIYALK